MFPAGGAKTLGPAKMQVTDQAGEKLRIQWFLTSVLVTYIFVGPPPVRWWGFCCSFDNGASGFVHVNVYSHIGESVADCMRLWCPSHTLILCIY